jgi:hypothetical protein
LREDEKGISHRNVIQAISGQRKHGKESSDVSVLLTSAWETVAYLLKCLKHYE